MLGCYLSPSQPNVCRATRPSPSPTARIAILSIFRGERCQIGAALAEEPECPVNPQSDPMSIACNERNRTAPPPSGRSESIRRRHASGTKDIVAYSSCGGAAAYPPAVKTKYLPNCNSLRIVEYSPDEDGDFRTPPAHLIVVSLLGGFMESAAGWFGLRRAASGASKRTSMSESGAGSFSLRSRPRRGQSEACRESLAAYEGGAAAAGPLAAGGGQRRRSDDECT